MTQDEQSKFVTMQNDISEVKGDINLIKTALLGDNYMSLGLVGELKEIRDRTLPDLDSRIEKLETLKNKIIWITLGAGLAGGFGIKTVLDWIAAIK